VTATPLALKEQRFQDLVSRVDDQHLVDLLPLPGLVDFAQHFVFDEPTVLPYLQEKLAQYNWDQYGAVVLGCTHFPHFRHIFRKLLPLHIEIIDGSTGTVNHLQHVLFERELLAPKNQDGEVTCYTSGRKEVDRGKLQKYAALLR
jgi:glutamate racemase